jgi:hypothetical protein
MSDRPISNNAALIAALTRDMRPVRRLAPPWRRALGFVAACAWVAGFMALFADIPGTWHQLTAMPDLGLAALGSVLTALAACGAAFLTSVPGRSPWWAALPLPPLALWLGASAAGCLRPPATALTQPESAMHPMLCFYFIVLVSAPLAALMVWQIFRACALRPALTASLAGLASAGAAASLLTLVHPFDATVADLAMHGLAVGVVVGAVRLYGARTRWN